MMKSARHHPRCLSAFWLSFLFLSFVRSFITLLPLASQCSCHVDSSLISADVWLFICCCFQISAAFRTPSRTRSSDKMIHPCFDRQKMAAASTERHADAKTQLPASNRSARQFLFPFARSALFFSSSLFSGSSTVRVSHGTVPPGTVQPPVTSLTTKSFRRQHAQSTTEDTSVHSVFARRMIQKRIVAHSTLWGTLVSSSDGRFV